MRIKRIELCNFGSYVGVCKFDLETNKKGNIVLIGGKNGAGKTTLFSGIKLCLYGNKAAGFENVNAFYRKEVKKYINDVSKFDISSKCYVKIEVLFSNGQEDDVYKISRIWNNNADSLENFEVHIVEKNGMMFNSEELADFDNYIMNVIPPELFDLFFFDGEQIADYFLDENSSERVKNAFMILCGYDTFDIMQKNFKRLAFGKKTEESCDINYIEAKQQVEDARKEYEKCISKIADIKAEIESVNSEIKTLDKKYKLSGGVTYDEWNNKLLQIKEEERFREEKNIQLKKMANDMVPFIIVKKSLEKLSVQLSKEHDKQQYDLLQKSLKILLPSIMHKVYKRLDWKNDTELTNLVLEEFHNEIETKKIYEVVDIINLSEEEYIVVKNAISRYIALDKEVVIAAEKEIKNSIVKTQKLRQEMERYSVDGAHEYLKNKMKLVEKSNMLTNELQDFIAKSQENKLVLEGKISLLKREEKKFDEASKNFSITELSEKSVAFLDVLQKRLYRNEIKKAEELFMKKIKDLAQKNKFIDSIMIDADFNVHIYKSISFNTKSVCNRIKKMGVQAYWTEYGTIHCQGLLNSVNVKNLNEFVCLYDTKDEKIDVLQEIEKSRLSKGEKQVFIMALYWAFMKLNKQEVPFVIDTPFARIDTEHRANITKNFFMDLSGQIFIFSTNEEIVGEHYEKIKDSIQAKFLLENSDNLQTTVHDDVYFGG